MRKQKHLWFGKQKKHWEYLGWLADCTETHRVSTAAAVGMLFKAIPLEQEQWDNPLLTCMIHWNVELIRQSNWLNICSCFIIILKWALSLCMPGMAKYLLAFLIQADSGVYISIALKLRWPNLRSNTVWFFFFSELFWRKGLEKLMSRWKGEVWGDSSDLGKLTCWAMVTDRL